MDNITEYRCFFSKNAKAINKVDEDICQLINTMEPIEIHIPSIIKKNILERIGYFDSFPHQIMGIKSIMETKQYNDFVLTPSACLHLYPIFEKYNIQKGIFTTKARVYRNEIEKLPNGKTRLIDFTVREIVVVGTEVEVKELLIVISKKILQYAKELGMDINLKSASDPFYPSKENLIKKKLQIGNNQKKEMIVSLKNEEVSIGSINYHGFHFSKTFNFDNNNTIVSGCIGLGLERWIYSLDVLNLIDNVLNYKYGELHE